MPSEQPPRPGLEQIAQQGEEWQHEKITDLATTFGEQSLIARPTKNDAGRTIYEQIELIDELANAKTVLDETGKICWLVEAQFEIGQGFKDALGIAELEQQFEGLEYSELRPDLIEVATPQTFAQAVSADGQLTAIEDGDHRAQLRVIDIKLTSEPSAGYFAEVVLYSMALAGWIEDNGHSEEWIVVSDAALWSGSHDASILVQSMRAALEEGNELSTEELRDALSEDLEVVPFEVFAPRVRKFFQHDVPSVLSEDWSKLEWHVDTKCKSCGFVGGPWRNANGPTADAQGRHCIQNAETAEHLSRVADVTQGARVTLEQAGVSVVSDLAGKDPEDPLFDGHYTLRATKAVVTERAKVSSGGEDSVLVPNTGTSAVMPKWSDLKIEISVDFDISSAITVIFAARATFYNKITQEFKNWNSTPFGVGEKSTDAEFEAFKGFLEYINVALNFARNANPDAAVQFYVWDQLELKHLSRVVGRHLEKLLDEDATRDLAWLFPSEELLANPEYLTRNSPITVVRDVVRSHVAAPVPHYYSLLETARVYHYAGLEEEWAKFDVHPLFADPLSDQIPSERAHEIWTKSTKPPWLEQAGILSRTAKTRLGALQAIRRRLEDDLKGELQAIAPKIRIGAMNPLGGMAIDSELIHAFAKLDAAVDGLDIDQVRAMATYEREAKFRSARLTKRVPEGDEASFLDELGVTDRHNVRVYEIPESSREVRARDGDIGFAVSPENEPGFLDQPLKRIVEGTALDKEQIHWRMRMEQVLSVSIVSIDRERQLIAVRFGNFVGGVQLHEPEFIQRLEDEAGVNLTSELILDPVQIDVFTKKLRTSLQAIKNPPSADKNSAVMKAIGYTKPRGPNETDDVAPADFLWEAGDTYGEVIERDLAATKQRLLDNDISLNDSQWSAWDAALTKRLQTIWGPPGTGKSQTIKAIVHGAATFANLNGEHLRVLICTNTYNALDNVFRPVAESINEIADTEVDAHRLRSGFRAPVEWAAAFDHEVNKNDPSEQTEALRDRLDAKDGITLVGATPQQVWALLQTRNTSLAGLFDLVVIDEASQVDVGNAILALCAVDDGAQLVIAGDPLQLPPIHQAKPPLGLEHMVGSIYKYYEQIHGVEAKALTTNYRSNDEIVGFARAADYPRELESTSKALRIRLDAAPADRPEDWPTDVIWSEELESMIEADPPTTAFVYDDENWSSQWNHFESATVVGLVVALHRRMKVDLAGEIGSDGQALVPGEDLIDDETFWSRAVGVVTPHRAQQALVIAALTKAFPETSPALIRDAVDTVERFQGQERDVIIVSYALGDPDAIREEDEFLMGSERFNVAASRARAKLIVLISEQVAEHLSHEVEVMRDSRLLKLYVDGYCDQHHDLALNYMHPDGEVRTVEGQFRWRA